MSPLEHHRLRALGHTQDQVDAIKVYEQKVKEDVVHTIRRVINKVPDHELAKPPYYVRDKLEQLLKDMLR